MPLIETAAARGTAAEIEAKSEAGPMRASYVPKIKVHAEIVMVDGRVLTGYAFLEATLRLQDMLNSGNQFFPFLDTDQNVHLLSKSAVVSVRPL